MGQLKDFFTKIKEKIWEQEEFIKLRNQFSELDLKTQQTIFFSTILSAFLGLTGLLIALIYSSYSLKSQMQEMNDQILYIQSANEKMDLYRNEIRDQGSDLLLKDVDKNAPLPLYSTAVAQKSSIAKENIEVVEKPGSGGVTSVEVKLNKISLRQLQRMLFLLENAKNGVDIVKVDTDSKNDPEGYLWAVISLQKKLASSNSNATKKSLFTR